MQLQAMALAAMRTLETLNFDNKVPKQLKIDQNTQYVTRPVRGANFSRVDPTPVNNPQTVAVSHPALQLLDIGTKEVERPEFAQYLSGSKLLPGAEPLAHCYCGYQFGHFSGQLGDGAAIYLGEVVNSKGERWELQLKGAGLTPYSRQADGRKVLRSSIREFLCSEAMAALGIATTRAGSVVTSDTLVVRDIHYTGNPIRERASVVSRIAPSFLRFGSFEIFKTTDPVTGRAGPSAGLEHEMLPDMVNFVIQNYYPDIWAAHGGEGSSLTQRQDMYLAFFRELVKRTAVLVAAWQCVGWCHGVLNTDNMSILGLTLDYGPFQFMDRYDPDHICNGSDDTGRYDYKSQPEICRWNCEKLAEALAPVLPLRLSLPEARATFDIEYDRAYMGGMRRKLGLLKLSDEEYVHDAKLVQDLLALMAESGADFTNTFRNLAAFPTPAGPSKQAVDVDAPAGPTTTSTSSNGSAGHPDGGCLALLLQHVASPSELAAASKPRIGQDSLAMLVMLAARDPEMLQGLGASKSMIQTEMDRSKRYEQLQRLSPEAKAEQDRAKWSAWLQRYGDRLARDAAAGADPQERRRVMDSTNPRIVLRNWMAQEAISQAEKGDYSGVADLLAALQQPYLSEEELAAAGGEGQEEVAQVCSLRQRFAGQVPDWATGLCVTCSS